MLVADTDLQVWLETIAGTQPCIIVPYAQSTEDGPLHYQIEAISESKNGRSVIRQSNTITLAAGTPTALGNMAVSRSMNDSCQITIYVSGKGGALQATGKSYQFLCPD